jgi:hypothetical protein
MIHKTEDLRYLLKLEDYEILPDNIALEPLKKAWEQIIIEYQEAEDNNSGIIKFVQGKSILKLELDYLILWNIYNLMVTIPDSKDIEQLKKDAGIEGKELEWIEKQLKILGNKLRIKRKTLSNENKKDDNFDFLQLIDEIESIKGYEINIYKVTVRKYIAIKKNIKAKIKNGRQNNPKGRNR